MSEKMKALILHAPGKLSVEEWEKPSPAENEVLVKVRACGVCGSDLPRVNVQGAYYHPIIPGHEFAGEVVEQGPGVEFPPVGARVTVMPLEPCMQCDYCRIGEYTMCENYSYYGSRKDGAFAQYIAVRAANCLLLPDNVSFEAGAMTDPAAVALHGLRRGELDFGWSAAVLGAGPIGLFAAQWLKLRGCGKLFVIDLFEEKLDLLRALGLPGEVYPVNAKSLDPVEYIRSNTAGRGVNFAIDTAGSPVTQALAVDLLAKFGNLVYVGSATGDVDFNKARFEQLLRRQLTVKGSWNSYIKPFPVNEWQTVIDFLASGQLQAEPLISHKLTLEELPDALKWMYERKQFFSKVLALPWEE